MIESKYMNPFRMDEGEGEKENDKQEPQSPLLMKKMEQLFLDKRAVYLWGPVDDKSARDVLSKLLLLDADKQIGRAHV